MKIFMVRHGETDHNVARRIQGQEIDESLNETGRKQAQERAEALADEKFDVIFSSPLKRARETAEIIAEKVKAPILLRDEIKERVFGKFSGRTFEEINAEMGTDWNQVGPIAADEELKRIYGRETAEDFKRRLVAFTDEVKRSYPEKRVLVVAHGGLIRLAHFLFKEVQVEHVHNASIEEFEI